MNFWACCTNNCEIASDNFDRADSTTVDGWTEVTSGWEIAGNALKPPFGGLNDVIRFDTPDPGTADGIRWSTAFNSDSTEFIPGEMKWIVDYVDANNFHYGEVVSSGANQVTLRLYRRESGTNTELAELVVNGFDWGIAHTVAVCWGFQYTIPICGGGTIVWLWTLNYGPMGEPGWQPREMYGACQNAGCGVVQPAVTGLEEEGDTTTTACESIFPDAEGEDVFAMTLTLVDMGVGVSAVAQPLGGTYVGLGINNAPSTFRFDDAKLTLLQNRCPTCSTYVLCSHCINNVAPKYLEIIIPSGPFTGTYIQEYFGFPFADRQPYECEIGSPKGLDGCNWGFNPLLFSGSNGRWGQLRAGLHIDGDDGKLYLYVLASIFGDTIDTEYRWRIEMDADGDPINCMTDLNSVTVPYYCHRQGNGTGMPTVVADYPCEVNIV